MFRDLILPGIYIINSGVPRMQRNSLLNAMYQSFQKAHVRNFSSVRGTPE